jgi:hypothetical protein
MWRACPDFPHGGQFIRALRRSVGGGVINVVISPGRFRPVSDLGTDSKNTHYPV